MCVLEIHTWLLFGAVFQILEQIQKEYDYDKDCFQQLLSYSESWIQTQGIVVMMCPIADSTMSFLLCSFLLT